MLRTMLCSVYNFLTVMCKPLLAALFFFSTFITFNQKKKSTQLIGFIFSLLIHVPVIKNCRLKIKESLLGILYNKVHVLYMYKPNDFKKWVELWALLKKILSMFTHLSGYIHEHWTQSVWEWSLDLLLDGQMSCYVLCINIIVHPTIQIPLRKSSSKI